MRQRTIGMLWKKGEGKVLKAAAFNKERRTGKSVSARRVCVAAHNVGATAEGAALDKRKSP